MLPECREAQLGDLFDILRATFGGFRQRLMRFVTLLLVIGFCLFVVVMGQNYWFAIRTMIASSSGTGSLPAS